jgi:integrase
VHILGSTHCFSTLPAHPGTQSNSKMARKTQDARLASRTARLRLPVSKQPYNGPALARGIHLLYRRNVNAGSWIVKATASGGGAWSKSFAIADDIEDADGQHVLNFHQACDAAKALARGKADTPDSKPVTVADALTAYAADLKNRGGHAANATRVKHHMNPALAAKPVGLLTARDLQAWRDGLIGRMEASSVRRTSVGLRAALELAASLDHRITNRHVYRLGLRALPGSNRARKMVLPNADVLRIVEAAYAVDRAFGLLVEVLAVTGARISQAARLTCADLQGDRPDPRVMMPSSFKGSGQKQVTHRPVPITAELAAALQEARAGRPDDAPILLKSNGTAWQANSTCDHGRLFAQAIELAGLDPKLTSYCLRHSSIVRGLLNGVPTTVVAQSHDTSTKQIESHYGAYLTDFSDALSRKALLTKPAVTGGNVVALPMPVRR